MMKPVGTYTHAGTPRRGTESAVAIDQKRGSLDGTVGLIKDSSLDRLD